MKTAITRRAVLLSCLAAVPAASQTAPRRLKRSESFLGIHFDFHAGPDCKDVGKNTTPAMIERIIDLVHPDYLQIDCKGHPGYSSYPTKVGNPVASFVGDPLHVWREVTARRGVALYVHYSGVIDSHAAKRPGWGAVKADGKPHESATSLFGPYVDELMIPQLREIAGYGVDGVWVDGDCWGAVADYSEAALKAFRDESGIVDVPRKAGAPHWLEFLEFHRKAYRRYLGHYVAEVKKTNPEFQICSNWAFTDHMPEAVSVRVDFLSGDFDPQSSVNSARMAGRYLVRQGKSWDLMAWSFSSKAPMPQKSAVQLQREAAIVLALGGGFQAYYRQNRDGSVPANNDMVVMAEVARFCRTRQSLCHHAEPVPQIGLLFSTAAHYRRQNGLFSRNHPQLDGVLQALLESRHAVELVSESQLAGQLAEYPLLVVPECEYLEPRFQADLARYARAGGNLLLIGPKTAALFAAELGVQLEGAAKPVGKAQLAHGGKFTALKGERQVVRLGAGAKAFGELQESGSGESAAASIARLGSGQIAATYFTFGQAYREAPDEIVRQFLDELTRRLFPHPMVEISGAPAVDVSVAKNNGKLLVHLVNTSGPHRTEPIVDSIAPLGPLQLSIHLPRRPSKVMLEPSGLALRTRYRDGKVTLTVPSVEIHEAVVIYS